VRRFGRVGRRADSWASVHERARVRAAERLGLPLKPSEAAWLDAHLADCAACRAIAEAYAADRLALRLLRDAVPDPPRDLWARTAAGIEREASLRRRDRRSARPGPARSRSPIGVLSGIAVVAVVLIATALSGGFLGNFGVALASSHPAESQNASLRAAPTAIAVGAGEVRWLGARDDGAFAYNVANIDAVCPLDRQPDCAPFADGHARRMTLNAIPKFVFQSPVDDQAVVVGTDAAGADAIIVVALPTPEVVPTEVPTIASSSPTASSATIEPGATPPVTPSGNPAASELATLEPPTESASPGPGVGTAIAIITDVTIVGRGAGYSTDGAWFAFSARPANGSAGPDIYVWHAGDPLAVPLTSDHASVFASWVGNQLLGSRAMPDPAATPDASPLLETTAPTEPSPSPVASPSGDVTSSPEPTPAPEFAARTFLIDPSTGVETPMLGADWGPVVDPTGVWVAAWEGTVRAGPDGLDMVPATGRLVIHAFQPLADPAASPGPSVQPSEPATEQPTEPPSDGSPVPSAGAPIEPQVVAEGPIAEFDARWDDTGTWLAIWLADPVDPSIGRLSLLHIDPTTGLIDRPLGAPQDVTALPGFSMGAGRLAWATPPGQGGEESRIQIIAWTENDVGAVASVPVEGAIVVQ
jgi:hypothetical protein